MRECCRSGWCRHCRSRAPRSSRSIDFRISDEASLVQRFPRVEKNAWEYNVVRRDRKKKQYLKLFAIFYFYFFFLVFSMEIDRMRLLWINWRYLFHRPARSEDSAKGVALVETGSQARQAGAHKSKHSPNTVRQWEARVERGDWCATHQVNRTIVNKQIRSFIRQRIVIINAAHFFLRNHFSISLYFPSINLIQQNLNKIFYRRYWFWIWKKRRWCLCHFFPTHQRRTLLNLFSYVNFHPFLKLIFFIETNMTNHALCLSGDWACDRHRRSSRNVIYWRVSLQNIFIVFHNNFIFFYDFSNEPLCAIFSEQSPAEEKKQKEEKKRYLLRKLSFRPTVEELKEKKVKNI